MELVVHPDGSARCVYGEELDLHALGRLEIRRASHVEPTDGGLWRADLGPIGGPNLGPFQHRGEALTAEREWLERKWLDSAACPHHPGEAKP